MRHALLTLVFAVLISTGSLGYTPTWGVAVHLGPSRQSRQLAFVEEEEQSVQVQEVRHGWIRVTYTSRQLTGWISGHHLIDAMKYLPLVDDSGGTQALPRKGKQIIVVEAADAWTRVRTAEGQTGELPISLAQLVDWISTGVMTFSECELRNGMVQRKEPWKPLCRIVNPLPRLDQSDHPETRPHPSRALALQYRVLPKHPSSFAGNRETGILAEATEFLISDTQSAPARIRISENREADLPISRHELVAHIRAGRFRGASVVTYDKHGETFAAAGSLPVQSSASVALISSDWTKLNVNDRARWIRTEYRLLFDR